jgi:hypothetical protein
MECIVQMISDSMIYIPRSIIIRLDIEVIFRLFLQNFIVGGTTVGKDL